MNSPPLHQATAPDWDQLLRTCIHCGLCLNDCPTYRTTGNEAESPRGRLMILREILDPLPGMDLEVQRGPIDRCLGCRACESVCPSGVPYGRLLEEGRSRLDDPEERNHRIVRMISRYVLPHRRRLMSMVLLGRLARLSRIPSGSFARLLATMPSRRPHWPRLSGPRHGRVAVLAGRAQPVFSPGVLPATLKLIRAVGEEPFVPEHQGCCGALAAHVGDRERAKEMGRAFIECFESAESIVIPSAGCSAHVRAFGELFADDPEYAVRAAEVADRAQDLVVWLAERADRLQLNPDSRRVVFQRPCHLRHAQKVDGAAEGLLLRVGGVKVLQSPRADLCCGSAGTWSMQYPEMASRRRDEKMADLLVHGPELILTANPGCELFLDGAGGEIEVQHLAEYLAGRIDEV